MVHFPKTNNTTTTKNGTKSCCNETLSLLQLSKQLHMGVLERDVQQQCDSLSSGFLEL